MSAASQKCLVIDQAWLDQNRNEKANDAVPQRVVDVCDKTAIAARGLKVLQKGVALANELSKRESTTLMHLDQNLGIALPVLNITRIPSETKAAIQSVAALNQTDDGISIGRKVWKVVRDVFSAVATWGAALMLIKAHPGVQTVTQLTDVTSDVADLQISTSDYLQAAALESKAKGEVKEALTHSKKALMWRIAKIGTSLITAMVGMTALVLGASFVAAVAWSVFALSAALIAITKDVYKDLGAYKVIDFDRAVEI